MMNLDTASAKTEMLELLSGTVQMKYRDDCFGDDVVIFLDDKESCYRIKGVVDFLVELMT